MFCFQCQWSCQLRGAIVNTFQGLLDGFVDYLRGRVWSEVKDCGCYFFMRWMLIPSKPFNALGFSKHEHILMSCSCMFSMTLRQPKDNRTKRSESRTESSLQFTNLQQKQHHGVPTRYVTAGNNIATANVKDSEKSLSFLGLGLGLGFTKKCLWKDFV